MIDFSDSENIKKISNLLYLRKISDIAREMGYNGKRPDNMLRSDLSEEGGSLEMQKWELVFHGKKKKRVYNKKPDRGVIPKHKKGVA